MASVPENLEKILQARYGEEVRGAIHDSINDCYNYSNGNLVEPIANDVNSLVSHIFNDEIQTFTLDSVTNRRWTKNVLGHASLDTGASGWSSFSKSVTGGEVVHIEKLTSNGSGPCVMITDSSLKVLVEGIESSGIKEWSDVSFRVPANGSQLIVNTWNPTSSKPGKVHLLESNMGADKLDEFVSERIDGSLDIFKINDYSKVNDYSRGLLADKDSATTLIFGATALSDGSFGFQNSTGSPNGGIETNNWLSSNSNMVLLHAKGTTNLDEVSFQIHLKQTDGSTNAYRNIKKITDKDFDVYLYFDAAYYAVYQDMEEFKVCLNATRGTGWCKIEAFEVSESEIGGLRSNKLYRPRLDDQFSAIFEKIGSIENPSDDQTDNGNDYIISPNGTKWRLVVNDDGTLKAVSNIPNNVLLMGNSLVFGLGEFGMCASSSRNDWVYYVKEAVKEKNPSCSFDKLHCAPFEQAEDDGTASSYITTNSSRWKGKNLIIIQIGDNANNDSRRTTFSNNFSKLIGSIRSGSPEAAIIVVGIWFTNSTNVDTITKACDKYGAKFVRIDDLSSDKENQGFKGMEIHYDDGRVEIAHDNWITHPGNKGMKLIADRIISAIDL